MYSICRWTPSPALFDGCGDCGLIMAGVLKQRYPLEKGGKATFFYVPSLN